MHVSPAHLAAFATALVAGCVYQPGDTRPARSEPLSAVVLSPETAAPVMSLRVPFVLAFDGPIDPRRSDIRASIALTSGVFVMPLRIELDPLDHTLTATPVDPLEPNLTYTWEVDETRLRGAGGRPVAAVDPYRMPVAASAMDPEPTEPVLVRWDDVAPIVAQRCDPCHSESPLEPIRPIALGLRSTVFTDRRLVAPYDAPRSYLIEKLVPDYPDRFGAVMPPPWGDQPPLTAAELRLLVDWVADGALP